MLQNAIEKAISNLLLPEVIKLFMLCLLVYVLGWFGLSSLIGSIMSGWANVNGAEGFIIHLMIGMGGWMIAWFLFPLLYPVLVSFFDDYMAEAIEKRDYPHLPPAHPPFWPTFLGDLWFSVKAILLNILLLPFYFIPFLGVVLYFCVNGQLLGRQFFRMVAGRRVDEKRARELIVSHRLPIFLGGVAVSVSATIPLLNLVSPLLAVAVMLHLFHAMHTAKVEILPPSE